MKLSGVNIIHSVTKPHQATVIFFHGSGSSGSSKLKAIKDTLADVPLPHIQFLFPTAPLQPYDAWGGERTYVWFNRDDMSPDSPEISKSVFSIGKVIQNFVRQEVRSGIPLKKIIAGGFSMGGSMAMYTAYKFVPGLAGAFALSSFLQYDCMIYDNLKNNSSMATVPLLWCHGDSDDIVPEEWGRDAFDNLKKLGVNGEYNDIKNLGHSVNREEMQILFKWIKKILGRPK